MSCDGGVQTKSPTACLGCLVLSTAKLSGKMEKTVDAFAPLENFTGSDLKIWHISIRLGNGDGDDRHVS